MDRLFWRPHLAVFWFGISCSLLFSQVTPPGKLTNTIALGAVTFHYPQNWQILKQKSADDILIGPPDALARWEDIGEVEDKKHHKKRGFVEHTMISHGVLCGSYEPNAPSPEWAADELLGRFHQYYESLSYVEGTDRKMQANKRPILFRGVKIKETEPDLLAFAVGFSRYNTRLEANGSLFLVQDGQRVWYWLVFTPPYDEQQYRPTFAAMLASIAMDGKGIQLEEVKESAALPHPGPDLNSELTAADIAKRTLPSVVVLNMRDSKGHPLKLGSGFFVRDNLIATNFHVIDGAQQAHASVVGDSQLYRVLGTVAVDNRRDLALLAVDGPKAPLLQLDDPASPVAVGDTVYVAGNPEGLEGTFSQGIVSGVRQQGESALMQITAPISPGSSGGPVLNQKGRVVGVAVATFKEGQNLNFAVPVIQLSELLLKVGPVTPLAGAQGIHHPR
jgi:hypothetical protein